VCVCVRSEEQVASGRQIGKPFCFTHTHPLPLRDSH